MLTTVDAPYSIRNGAFGDRRCRFRRVALHSPATSGALPV
jgi:hypothetical protein